MELEKELKNKEKVKDLILPIIYDYKDKRDKIFEKENEEELKKEIKEIKEYSIKNIEELKKKAISNLEKNGIKVFEAKDANQAIEIIKKIIGKEKTVLKSKSNTCNEISLKENLKEKEIIETDTGDFIVEICKEKGIHPVLPAMHLTPKVISDRIYKKFGKKIMPDAKSIAGFVREYIRSKDFKIGITGANAITSDGKIITLENEGNISYVSKMPDKHVIIAGFEKIVPSLKEALVLVKCSSIWGTAQEWPVYVNIISGPSKTSDIENKTTLGAQGAKEVYLILLDNGRNELIKKGFSDLLYCINCGACLNFCPIFHQITNSYGSKYNGSKGVIFSAFNQSIENSVDNGLYYCILCQACKENCPLDIDLPEMVKKLREISTEKGLQPDNSKEMIKNFREYKNPFGKVEKGETPKELYCC